MGCLIYRGEVFLVGQQSPWRSWEREGETVLEEETEYVELATQKKSGHEYATCFPVPSPELGGDPETHRSGGEVGELMSIKPEGRSGLIWEAHCSKRWEDIRFRVAEDGWAETHWDLGRDTRHLEDSRYGRTGH